MEMNPAKPQNMIDTTDALEAVSVCQSMKNLLFVLILLGLFVCQIIFWMNHFDLIRGQEGCTACPVLNPQSGAAEQKPSSPKPEPQANAQMDGWSTAPVSLTATTDLLPLNEAADEKTPPASPIEETIDDVVGSTGKQQPEEGVLLEKEPDFIPVDIPAKHASPEMLEPADEAQEAAGTEEDLLKDKLALFRISSDFAKTLVRVCNYIILTAAILYCLTLLICLKVSLVGRLGGINHIARAFFVSLFLLVVLVPWQTLLPGFLIGALWRPGAIWCECWARADGSLFWEVMLYLRFCGLWLLAVGLLLSAQGRSAKWARATLRRLGVVR